MAFSLPIRPDLQNVTPYTPGLSIDEIKQKYGLDHVIKMASNENPLGTSPLVQERIAKKASSVFRYAQSGTPKLQQALAAHLQVPVDCIVLGNGSDEVIDLLIRSCAVPGKNNVVASRPSFSLYELQAKFCGVEYRPVPLKADFSFDWQGLLQAIDANTSLVFITTPDNPSGYCPTAQEVLAFAKQLPPTCLLVVDEAYIDFCDNMDNFSLLRQREALPQLVILRTFSKCYGLAGMRLGYGIMPESLAKLLCSVRLPFSINILAEEAGLAALEDVNFYNTTLAVVKEGRAYLTHELNALGWKVFPSHANFIMVTPPATCPLTAQEIFERLLEKGIIIRPLKSYGMPESLRITIGDAKENQVFITMLSQVLQ